MKEGTFRMGECAVIVSIDSGRWHLSISAPGRLPTYEELKKARYEFLPDEIYAAQIFPPQSEFVNVNPHVLHLWEIRDAPMSGISSAFSESIGKLARP